jgi:hypothetical protein
VRLELAILQLLLLVRSSVQAWLQQTDPLRWMLPDTFTTVDMG